MRAFTVAALGYFVAAILGMLCAIDPGASSPVWPASGIAFGLLFLSRWEHVLPGVFLGSFAANVYMWGDLGSIEVTVWQIMIGLGACAQAFLGWWWLSRRRRWNAFSLAIKGGLPCAVNAAIGAAAMGSLYGADFFYQFSTWLFGDAIGVVVFGQVFLYSKYPRINSLIREYYLFSTVFTAVLLVVFFAAPAAQLYFGAVIAAGLAWSLTRYSPGATAIQVLVINAVGIWATSFGRGPLTGDGYLWIQLYCATLAIGVGIVAPLLHRDERNTIPSLF